MVAAGREVWRAAACGHPHPGTPRWGVKPTEDTLMTTRGSSGIGGITIGGIIVIIGIIVAIVWSLILGIIIALIGLIAFGGFARGRWY
jgi:hypothetical protein